jgi:hypothetical protein
LTRRGGNNILLPVKYPKRSSSKRKRIILLSAIGSILVILTALAIWQRETVYYVFNPCKIQIKTEADIRETLYTDVFGEITKTRDGLIYYLFNGTVRVGLAFDDNRLLKMEIIFNANSIPVSSISDAFSQAHSILAPYFTPPEINALCILFANEIPSYVTGNSINYQRDIGEYSLVVYVNMITGEVNAELYKHLTQ